VKAIRLVAFAQHVFTRCHGDVEALGRTRVGGKRGLRSMFEQGQGRSGKELNLVMLGTGDFAVPTFLRLLDEGFKVALLVTQPDRPRGRGRKTVPTQIKLKALERNVPVYQPENVNCPESVEHLRAVSPDLFVLAAYGQILSAELLGVPRLGGINLHGSLLPKYRGAAPVNWAIYHGEEVTGVTVIRMTPEVDAGEILLQAETRIGSDETAGELEQRLAELGAPLVCEAIELIASGRAVGKPQDPRLASKAPKLKKRHGLINWARPAQAICNQIRAMQPWPTAYSFLHRRSSQQPLRVIIERAAVEAGSVSISHEKPGTVLMAERENLIVAAADGAVRIERLRPAGKRAMSAAEFLRGYHVSAGDRFGPE